jgi:DNA end-binding protein Ku
MPRAIWSGAISFGLVSIPVRLVSAVKHREVQFHELHESDGSRIYEKRFCAADDKEVSYDHIVKGFQLSKKRWVMITPRELEAANPKASRVIEIEDFVELADIDPIFYQHTYYLVPEAEAKVAYGLLITAMQQTGKVALGRIVMRQRQYLAAVRPMGKALVISTMLYADEIVPMGSVLGGAKSKKAGAREVAVANRVVKAMSREFAPSRYKDTHRARVLTLIRKKARGKKIEIEKVTTPRGTQVDRLLTQLEQSMATTHKR